MKTLVIAAHMDDEALSCGGLVTKRTKAGHEVHIAFMFDRVYDYGRETDTKYQWADATRAQSILGYDKMHQFSFVEGEPAQNGYYKMLEPIEKLLQLIAPEEVVIHGTQDRNQDHRYLNDVCRIALRPANLGNVTRILEMLPMDGGGPATAPTYFVPLAPDEVATKLSAVAAYRREARQHPHPRSLENVMAFMSLMGSACGVPAAEGFVLRLERHDESLHHGRVRIPRD